MAHTNVASCVISIVGSFSNGLDVFKKLREKSQRKRRPKKNDTVDREELRLSRSLRQGQEDIGREYQNNVYVAGDQFAIGDGTCSRFQGLHPDWPELTLCHSNCSDLARGDSAKAEHGSCWHHCLVREQ